MTQPTASASSPALSWATVYLASPAARFVNGVVLPVDGFGSIGLKWRMAPGLQIAPQGARTFPTSGQPYAYPFFSDSKLGSLLTSHPPPSALIKSTLASIRRRSISISVRSFVSAIVCAVITCR